MADTPDPRVEVVAEALRVAGAPEDLAVWILATLDAMPKAEPETLGWAVVLPALDDTPLWMNGGYLFDSRPGAQEYADLLTAKLGRQHEVVRVVRDA